jgi:hypothetical protein
MTAYPVGTAWVIAPIFTGPAATSFTFSALIRSISAH